MYMCMRMRVYVYVRACMCACVCVQSVAKHIRDMIAEVEQHNTRVARQTQQIVRQQVVDEIMSQFRTATGTVVDQVADIIDSNAPI